ncbi:glycosyltransferase family 39 protein [Plantactinospora sp. GCM10030261]|uniref:glycosyltransferase family 39 protein n=1 Tax=Plantactinospora sp. GCM10030261 TaxID=3273420 RepID=UPI00360C30E4
MTRVSRHAPWLVPVLLMAAVSAVRLGNPVLSWDEIATVDVASRDVGQIWRLSHTIDASVAPYYLFMHVWTTLFGVSEWALRAPSWLAMAVTAGLVGGLGRRLLTPATGLLAGLLFVLIPSSSRYAQEARVYAIATMLSVLAVLLLYRAIARPTAGRFVGYAVCVALLGAAHLIALATLAAHVVIVVSHVLRTGDRRTAGAWVAATSAGGLTVAPLAVAGADQVDDQLGWIYGPLTVGDLVTAPGAITGSVGVAWLLVGLATLATWRTGGRVAELTGLAVLPVSLVAAGAALGQPIWVPRYLLIATPPLALLAALGVRQVAIGVRERSVPGTAFPGTRRVVGTGRWAGVVRVAVVLVAVGWAALPDQRALRAADSHNGANYRQAAQVIAEHQEPDDVLLFEPRTRHTRPGVYYYLRHEPDQPADPLLDRSAAEVGDLRPVEATDPAGRLRDQGRVWLFVYGKPADPAARRPDLRPYLTEAFRPVRTWRMSSSTLVLYQRIHASA